MHVLMCAQMHRLMHHILQTVKGLLHVSIKLAVQKTTRTPERNSVLLTKQAGSYAACDLAAPQDMRSLVIKYATDKNEAPARYLSLQFLDPALGLGKAVFACDVKHNDSCSCPPASHETYCQNVTVL